jgi:hypothetical protein
MSEPITGVIDNPHKQRPRTGNCLCGAVWPCTRAFDDITPIAAPPEKGPPPRHHVHTKSK